jgi:imidazoleglycerol-phosphate dehydratase/histidinol-phosphatase
MKKKILFIDRDGTLIEEPSDEQVDSIEKLAFKPGVILALQKFQESGYALVMITNQDGLGTDSFPTKSFEKPHEFMLSIFKSQGIHFEAIRICPHRSTDTCECRKPKLGLILDYLTEQTIDRNHSYVIGDRETDMQFARNMGIQGIYFGREDSVTWHDVSHKILSQARSASVSRKTNETLVEVSVNLDQPDNISVETSLGFFNHMLEQLAKHGGFSLSVAVKGDLDIDDHHTVEDTALVIGEALRKALGDKLGINRYGFLLPMDEALVQVAIDLSGRPYFSFKGGFIREKVGDLSTELVPHFFRSLTESLKATLHIDVKGENTHHMIEATFKAVGRALRQAIIKTDTSLPSTKGLL